MTAQIYQDLQDHCYLRRQHDALADMATENLQCWAASPDDIAKALSKMGLAEWAQKYAKHAGPDGPGWHPLEPDKPPFTDHSVVTAAQVIELPASAMIIMHVDCISLRRALNYGSFVEKGMELQFGFNCHNHLTECHGFMYANLWW